MHYLLISAIASLVCSSFSENGIALQVSIEAKSYETLKQNLIDRISRIGKNGVPIGELLNKAKRLNTHDMSLFYRGDDGYIVLQEEADAAAVQALESLISKARPILELITDMSQPWTSDNMFKVSGFKYHAVSGSFDEWFTYQAFSRAVREVMKSDEWHALLSSHEGTSEFEQAKHGLLKLLTLGYFEDDFVDEKVHHLEILLGLDIVIKQPRLQSILEEEYAKSACMLGSSSSKAWDSMKWEILFKQIHFIEQLSSCTTLVSWLELPN
jgi:hypothetical protein